MIKSLLITLSLLFTSITTMAAESSAYLEITLKISDKNRAAAVGVYKKYKKPFLNKIGGARSKSLLIRKDDVQVLHGFSSVKSAKNYLKSRIFSNDVVNELKPLLDAAPEIKIYQTLK